ncbi:MAG: phosphoribosylformylglycinamidine synthase, partial [Treponema sp.]|nr:phosphoribosylformylglycinamidine synthase [Treponema sp.]
PTEIEPFGGAATCLGGAIRDPLSWRSYVYQSMRITGSGDPRASLSETIPGKLPQLKIVRDSAAGFASYGNQIGLATGQVAEFYHRGFAAKRMELGAVVGAVPASHVRREEPLAGDVILLIGGKTGRDGIGGATGSSKVHTQESVETAGAEVQKGNAVEERKIQRLFRNDKVTRLIKRCNDFGAGGVSVAVGELAAGLDINLDAVPRKYEGLDGIALAISESQERMAVVVAKEDAEALINLAAEENLSAVIIATVTAGDEDKNARLRMFWRGKTVIDLERSFLDSNGASR